MKMRALRFNTPQEANMRNHAEAVTRGCDRCDADVTEYWWPMVEQDGDAYLLIGNDAVGAGETVVDIVLKPPDPV